MLKLFPQNRFFYLFLALLVYFITSPFLVDSGNKQFIFGILYTLLVIVGVYSISHSRKVILIISAFAALAFFTHWVDIFTKPSITIYFLDYITSVIFIGLVTVIVLYSVIKEERVNATTIFGAVCGYLLIGLLWSYIYSLIYALDPNSFSSATFRALSSYDFSQHFTYYSFITLSTLGYGDITPVSNPAKMFAWMEAIFGQVYLTVWIAQLVGLHIAVKVAKATKEQEKSTS